MKRILIVLVLLTATLGIKVGTGKVYLNPTCDTFAVTSPIPTSAATTTPIATGVAGKNMYICILSLEGDQTSNSTYNFEYGQTTTTPCDTNTQTLFPAAVLGGASIGGAWINGWSAATFQNSTNATSMPPPNPNPLILPANATPYNICGVKGAAATSNGSSYVIYYAIH